MDKNELFATMPVPQALRRMIVPAAVSQIIVLIYNMADTFYIGRTNNPYMLAGASLILPVFNLLLCLSALASTFLRIRILATPLMFLSFFTVYLFQGFGIGRVAMVLAILRWAVFNIPMLVLLNALVGMYGILWTPAIGDDITVLLSLAAYLRWRPRARTETPQ